MNLAHPSLGSVPIETCDHCGAPGVPYEYKGRTFSGLSANRGERLCSDCLAHVVGRDGVNILATNRSGAATSVVNTATDGDKVIPFNLEGIDGRDLAKYARRRTSKR